jgi:hypothetical protein
VHSLSYAISYSLNDEKEPMVSIMDMGAKDVKEIKDLKCFSPLDHFNPKWVALWKQTGKCSVLCIRIYLII